MNALPDDPDNWFQAFTGNSKKWSTLSDGLADLGTALGAYSATVGGESSLNYTAIDRASKTTKDLINTINEIEWDGNVHLVGFQTSATNFGKGLSNFFAQIPIEDASYNHLIPAANTASELVDIVNKLPKSIGDKNLDNFPSIATSVGSGVAAFGKVKSIGEVNWDDARAAARVGGDLIEIINEYSDINDFDYDTFKSMCSNVGVGLGDYAGKISKINCELVSNSIDPLESLLDVSRKDDAEHDFSKFATAGNNLGQGFLDYCLGIQLSNIDAVKNSTETIEDLLDVTQKSDSYSRYEVFVEACANLANGLRKFNGTGNNAIDTNLVTIAVDAVSKLLKSMNDYPDAENVYENFGTACENLAFGFLKFNQASTILQGELPALDKLTTLFADLAKTMSELPSDYTNVMDFISAVEDLGAVDIKSLSDNVSAAANTINQKLLNLINDVSAKTLELTYQLGSLKEVISTQATDLAKPFTETLSSMRTGLKTTSEKMGDFVSAMETFGTNVGEKLGGTEATVKKKIEAILKVLSDAVDTGKEKGNELGSNIKEGFKAGHAHLGEGFKAKIEGILKTLDGARSSAYQSGLYFTQGFALGIQNPMAVDQVSSAAASIANTAIQTIKKKGEEGSPWKTTIQSGRFAAQGLAIGIRKDADLAKVESVKMVSGALSSFDQVLNDYDFNAEYTPSIRPVVDLSNLKTSTEAISTLMDTTANVGLDYSTTKELARKVGQVRNSTQEMRQYQSDMIASNQTVTDAINSLRNDVSNIDLTKQPPTELYIDGKKLASTIAKPMDQALGLRQRRGL